MWNGEIRNFTNIFVFICGALLLLFCDNFNIFVQFFFSAYELRWNCWWRRRGGKQASKMAGPAAAGLSGAGQYPGRQHAHVSFFDWEIERETYWFLKTE